MCIRDRITYHCSSSSLRAKLHAFIYSYEIHAYTYLLGRPAAATKLYIPLFETELNALMSNGTGGAALPIGGPHRVYSRTHN